MTDFSYQLYSSRNFPPLEDTLQMLSSLGYAQVEGYGGLFGADADPFAIRGLLDKNGLSMPTTHIGVDEIEANAAGVISLARVLGADTVFAPYLAAEQRPTDAKGWAAFAARLAEAGKPLLDAGLRFGWHNHDFELAQVDGEFVLDLILGGSDDVSLELDLAWVKVGGQDPVEWIAKHADRLVSVHLKDIAPKGEAEDEDSWADVGHGTMDWSGITVALKDTGVSYFVMEHDNPNDHERFARRSIEAARTF